MTYGNFQTGDFDAALHRLDNTKQINEKDPFIDVGDHVLMLVELVPFNHTTHGPSARASFEIVTTNNPKCMVGTRCTKLWNITRPSKFPNQPTDADKFADFVRNLIGGQPGEQVGPKCRALIRDRVQDQLGRGMLIHARGVNTSKTDKPWVEVYWKFHAQSPDEIKARRVQIEAKIGTQPQYQQPAQQQQMYQQQPPQPQYNQMQPQAQQFVQQYAPQMVQPPQQQVQQPQQGLTQQLPQQNNTGYGYGSGSGSGDGSGDGYG